MSAYNGRRGVNVSQYVANLNTIPSQQDPLDSPPDVEGDLALFTTNDFVDWDAGLEGSFDLNLDVDQRTTTIDTAAAPEPKMDFNLEGESLCFLLPFAYCSPEEQCAQLVLSARSAPSRPIGLSLG
jgi:hypothetical protein